MGRICLSLFKIPRLCEILLEILFMWSFQVKFSLRVRQRKSHCVTLSMMVLLLPSEWAFIKLNEMLRHATQISQLRTWNSEVRTQYSDVCQKSCQCFRNCWSIHLKVYDITRLSQVPRLLWFFLVVIGLLLYIIIVLYYILSACSSMSTICMRVPNMININIRIINNFELLSEIYECH